MKLRKADEVRPRLSFLRRQPRQVALAVAPSTPAAPARPAGSQPSKPSPLNRVKSHSKGLVAAIVVLVAFSALTAYMGYEEVDEVMTRTEAKEVDVSGEVKYSVSDTATSGLSPTGSFIVLHDITVTNEDTVDGVFEVTSVVRKGADASELGTFKTITAGSSYTFNLMHNRAWTDDFDSSYSIKAPERTGTEIKDETVEYTVTKTVWRWPWW